MVTIKDESNAGGFYITKYYGNTKESYLNETGHSDKASQR